MALPTRLTRGGEVSGRALRVVLGDPKLLVLQLLQSVGVAVGMAAYLVWLAVLVWLLFATLPPFWSGLRSVAAASGVEFLLVPAALGILFGCLVLFVAPGLFFVSLFGGLFEAASVHAAGRAVRGSPIGLVESVRVGMARWRQVLSYAVRLGFGTLALLLLSIPLSWIVVPPLNLLWWLLGALVRLRRAVSRRLPSPLSRLGVLLRPFRTAGGWPVRALVRLSRKYLWTDGTGHLWARQLAVPVLVFSGVGGRRMVRESADAATDVWGEFEWRSYGLSPAVLFGLYSAAFVLFGAGAAHESSPLLASALLVVVLLLVAIFFSGAVRTVAKTALYLSAEDGSPPARFEGLGLSRTD